MKTIPFLFFLALSFNAFSQNTDPLSYHTTRQLSDSSYAIKKANGDSTIFLFEGGGGSYSGMGNLANRNFPNDSVAVVLGGLKQWDYYRTGNMVKIVATVPIIPPPSGDFNYVVDNMDGTSAIQSVKIDGWNGNFNVTVDWGDGIIDSSYKNASEYTMTHTYSAPGIFNPKFSANDYTKPSEVFLHTLSNPINVTAIHNVSKFSNLFLYSVSHTNINTIDTFNFPPSVVHIDAVGNKFTSFNPVLPPGLITLDISSNSNLTSFTPNLPSTVNELYLTYCSLSTAEVNNILIYLDSLTFNAGAKRLDIRQGGSPPSGSGATALTSLTSKGWTITHD